MKSLPKRTWLLAVVATLALGPLTSAYAAYPEKAITIIVPFAPGTSPDYVARLVGPKLSARLGQPVVVENRVGAGGIVGTAYGAKAPADGYTLTMGHIGALTINPSIYKKLPYSPLQDFAPITLAATIPLVVLVSPTSGINTLQQLISTAKASPGKLMFASGGNGTASHITAVLFNKMAGLNMGHVPYASTPAQNTAILSGDVAMTFSGMVASIPLITTGKLRALAITGPRRDPSIPDVPTMAEAGLPGYEVVEWNGFVAPKGTPEPVLSRLNTELTGILNEPELQKMFRSQGFEPRPGSAADFTAWITSETARWSRVAKSINLTLD